MKWLFRWLFRNELGKLDTALARCDAYEKRLRQILTSIDVSVDVEMYHRYARSWAVVSIQGEHTDFIKFIDLGESDLRHIASFLRQFEGTNVKVDAGPHASEYLKIMRYK